MRFTLTSPCDQCPFRLDKPGFLSPKRALLIAYALLDRQETFSCHKTVVYDGEDGQGRDTPDTLHCAGALLFLEAQERPNQLMRIAERCGLYDRHALKTDVPVARSTEEWIAHMEE